MSSGTIVIRVQSPLHGTKRIEAKPTSRTEEVLRKIKEEFDLPQNGWKVWLNREKTSELASHKNKTLSLLKLKHGDMLFLDFNADTAESLRVDDSSSTASATVDKTGSLVSRASSASLNREVNEDEVDKELWLKDGKIPRERNEQFCHHNEQAKCLHCVPYEPYDEEYLAHVNPPIKFLSFHSYLRKLTGGVDKGKFVALENISCKIKAGCKEHPPWPGGICTKCQPNAITLQRQKYRHVDYVQFENPVLIERLLDYWRKTGKQRMGFMYGHYEHHKDVPLGIKAVVSAIYEPQQIGTTKSIELVEHASDSVNQIAERLGLRPVGWIFTDLVPLDVSTGTVKHFRGNVNSHFLSAEECIMAASFQARFPNICRLAKEGHYGSKFVSVVITGDSENHIHFEGYQVSNQCMALVRDDCLIPTRDAPELGYVKESSNEQYVPDVFYKVIDGYGNEVTQLARPLPVEYLLVDLPAAFPVDLAFTFPVDDSKRPFAIEHRDDIGDIQDFNSFAEYLHQFSRAEYMTALSDFHLLIYLATCDFLPLKDDINSLLDCIRDKDANRFHSWTKCEAWETVVQLMEAHTLTPPGGMPNVPSFAASAPTTGGGLPRHLGPAAGAVWSCQHCTFHNSPSTQTCEMCNLPRT